MIKFFRKIRQELLSKNKFNKYVIYAIGEIFLVVVGILIALQINEWNEDKKRRLQKTSYIERLMSDLKKDIENATTSINSVKNKQANIEELIHLLNTNPQRENLVSVLDEYFRIGWTIPSFEPTTNTYTNITQSGNFDLFEQNNLSDEIIDHYVKIQKIYKTAELNEEWMLPFDTKLVDQTSALEIDHYTKVLFKDKNKSQAIDNLIENKELLERNAANHYWLNGSFLDGLEQVINGSNQLIETLENELKNK